MISTINVQQEFYQYKPWVSPQLNLSEPVRWLVQTKICISKIGSIFLR
jgi:hypothetical protein